MLSPCDYVSALSSKENNNGDFSCLTSQNFTIDDYARCDSSPSCGPQIIKLPDLRIKPYSMATATVQNEVCKFNLIPDSNSFSSLYSSYF